MKLCKRNKVENQLSSKLLFDNYSYVIFNRTKEIPIGDWINVSSSENLFLNLKYLEIIENNQYSNQKYIYCIFYQENNPVGIVYFQLINFRLDIFGSILENKCEKKESDKINLIPNLFRLLTLGNNFISGEHGFKFINSINREVQFQLLERLCNEIRKIERLKGKISAILIKDFYPSTLPKNNPLTNSNFLTFSVEPNMILNIPDKTNNLKEYISLFSKKYRNRTKKIFSCAKGIEKKELELSEIIKYENEIYALYIQVYNHAKFKLVKLGDSYFSDCKRSFSDNFIITGYFKENKLIGFSSAFNSNDEILNAHFIGFDYKFNKEHEIYQNILYNFIEISINLKKKKLILGRTAAEIKSTIGAKSHEMICYIKPQNPISNLIFKPFVSFLQPSDWTPRNPFKE